jgi:transposase InsO family protein
MRLSRLDGSMACQRRSVSTRGASSPPRSAISGTMRTASRWISGRPGKPTDNAYVESFNVTVRLEYLGRHWFLDLDDAREKVEEWRAEYKRMGGSARQMYEHGTDRAFER